MTNKNPKIEGIQFKTRKVGGRQVHTADVDGVEIGVAYSDTLNINTGEPLGWYWDKRGVGTSRAAVDGAQYGTYFDSIEAAVAAVLKV